MLSFVVFKLTHATRMHVQMEPFYYIYFLVIPDILACYMCENYDAIPAEKCFVFSSHSLSFVKVGREKKIDEFMNK